MRGYHPLYAVIEGTGDIVDSRLRGGNAASGRGAVVLRSFAVLELLHRSLAVAATPDAYLFTDYGGVTAWKPNRVTKAFVRHRRAAGLRHFRLHDLRHFMATEMLQASVPIVVVSRHLDDRRVSTTLDSSLWCG